MSRLRVALTALSITLAVAAHPARADVVTEWNEAAIDTLRAAKILSIRQTRALAMMHIAMFDAVNAIDPRFNPYVYRAPAPAGASQAAAASEAAFKVLSSLAPAQSVAFTARNDAVLAALADPAARSAGVTVGDAAAEAILADRRNDGFDETVDPYSAPASPGVYQPTSADPMFPTRFPRMRPFGLKSSDQLRLPPPPPLDSPQFLRDLAEVRDQGDADKPHAPQYVEIAKFHAPPGFLPWNDIARKAASARELPLVERARIFALLNIVLSDALQASFDSKSTYQFWRPQTAIRAGGAGFGHGEITADGNWKSLIPAPMFAEYPCMHCTVGKAASTVLDQLVPDMPELKVTGGGGSTRTFRSYDQYAAEEAESRIMGGVHYRWSAIAGVGLGLEVSKADMGLLAPVH